MGRNLLKLKVDQSLLNTWDKSHALIDLYHRRALGLEPEMTCAAQAREILSAEATFGDSVLDVGCGTAWFTHSVQRAQLGLQYFGIDKTEKFIEIARQVFESSVLAPDRLFSGAVEHSFGAFDHVVCMNVLSNLDNWHRPLDRMAKLAKKTIILRESLAESSTYSLVVDQFLDSAEPLWVHVNTYSISEIEAFMKERGYLTEIVTDYWTGGSPELVIGYPHHWAFAVFRKVS